VKIHHIKCAPIHFRGLLNETKTFELRLNDRAYELGHDLAIYEFDRQATAPFSGRFIRCLVTCFVPVPESQYVVLGVQIRWTGTLTPDVAERNCQGGGS
jgi:hypothetical protein